MTTDPLPRADSVEKAVIGELLANQAYLDETLHKLTRDHFFTRKHATIFDAIMFLKANGSPVDPITVSQRLKDLLLLDEVGGAGYVSSCPFYPAGVVPSQLLQVLDEKLNLRRLIDLSEKIQKWAEEGGQSEAIIEKIGQEVISFAREDASGNLMDVTCQEIDCQIDRRLSGEKILGLKTGISPWDDIMGGLSESRFYVLAARGGKGKTALMEQVVDRLLVDQHPVLVFQKDMSPSLFVLRLACRRAGISFMKYDLGHCSNLDLHEIKSQIKVLKHSPIYLYSPASMTAEKMASIIKMEQRIHGIKAVFLDHVLNLEVGAEYRIGLTRASSRIRESCQQTKIPHVILAQLNRDGDKNERPTPSNIKEFDALYADCDHMMMLWSERDAKDMPPGELYPVKFTVNKNRYGSEFEEELGFDRPLMKFKTMRK